MDEKEEEVKTDIVKETVKDEGVMGRLFIKEYDDKMIESIIELSMIDGKKEIYISSPGGLASATTILIDLINQEPENYTIKVTEYIMSGAFLTILNAQCKVEDISSNMHFFTIFMSHDASTGGRVSKHVKKAGKKANEEMFNAIKHVLTDKQIKYYRRCHRLYKVLPFMKKFIYEDLYLSREQMRELLGERFSVSKR